VALQGLIPACICGVDTESAFSFWEINGIPLRLCQACSAYHQIVNLDKDGLTEYYRKEYDKKHCAATRYAHDREVAKKRMRAYDAIIPDTGKLLDIGCNNGAFVDEALWCGYDAYGNEVNPNIINKRTFPGILFDCKFKDGEFDVITMHDVLEHLIDPHVYLAEVRRVLNDAGMVVIDFPHFFGPECAHHFKLVEHLWYFTEARLNVLFEDAGFEVVKYNIPIPSKLVYFLKKR